MQITHLNDVQESLASIARQVLTRSSSMADVRKAAESETGYDTELWRQAAELGWLGLEVPEELGGSGQTVVETGLVMKELGRVAAPGPYLSHFIAIGALLHLAAGDAVGQWLPQLASGDCVPAVVLGELDGTGAPSTPIEATRVGNGVKLSGQSRFVLDAAGADVLLVVVRLDQELALVLVEHPTEVAMEVRSLHDRTRRVYDLVFHGVEVGGDQVVAHGPDAGAPIEDLWNRAALGVALDSVGGATRLVQGTVDYTSSRVQYGRPIATFQAVKHTCADMYVESETARIATDAALLDWAAGAGSRSYWCSNAKVRAGDAYAQVAGDALQMHGGIGMTWEFDLHIWLKRAKANQLLFGRSSAHRARLASGLARGSLRG